MTHLILTSPIRGWTCPLEAVPDPVFAQRMMGDGIAIQPLDDTLRAPCDGEIASLHDAGHAVSLRSPEGAEILIHVGLDTVQLKGLGFTALVGVGDRVTRGDPLIRFDLDAVAMAATSMITPIIVTNADAFTIERRTLDCEVGAGDELMALRRVEAVARTQPGESTALIQNVQLALPHGIHARPAAQLGECARGFEAEVHLVHGDRRGDARSTVALLALGTRHGDEITIEARGRDAADALEAMAALLRTSMGETADPQQDAPDEVHVLEAGQLGGVTASPGLAMGTAHRIDRVAVGVDREGEGADVERAALAAARARVRATIERSASDAATDVTAVLRAHCEMLDDPELLAAADVRIAEGRSAGYAWRNAIGEQVDRLRQTGNARLIERSDDLYDIERQVLTTLVGTSDVPTGIAPGAILIADDLLPSQLVALASSRLAGICLAQGGPTSHVAILAASMGIPALVAIGGTLSAVGDGTMLLLDADTGYVEIAPDTARAEAFSFRVAARQAARAAAQATAAEPCRTRDGTRIEVFANLGSVDEASIAAANGTEGCGLVRTEFLFLDRDEAPTEAQQLDSYQAIATALEGRPVIVRLLDIGGDKPARYVAIDREENPALGLRGIRLAAAYPELIETQIRAILRVRPVGQCRIMLPMVTSVAEVRAVRTAVDRVRGELGITEPVEVGVMVETPAAAATADLLAAEADFLSIGSNDLTQYVLAMDRGNPAVAAGVDPLHPAVLRMIGQTCTLAGAAERWVGICGGLASEPLAIPILIGLGITELSTVPGCVAEAKAIVRGFTVDAARAHAERALQCRSPAEVRALARAFAKEYRG